MSANLASVLSMLALSSEEKQIAEEVRDEISVGQSRNLPFGGKLRNGGGGRVGGSPMSVGAIGDGMPGSTPGGGSPEAVLMSILASFGGRPCQVRGEPMPVTADNCAQRLCLTQLFYSHAVPISSTAEPYTLYARCWFLPLVWVDYSNVAISVVSVTFQSNPIFESGLTSFVPASAFPATSNWNFVIGIPAISDKTGYVFSLASATAQTFQGKLVGIGVRTA